jgi:hypothetical protein
MIDEMEAFSAVLKNIIKVYRPEMIENYNKSLERHRFCN